MLKNPIYVVKSKRYHKETNEHLRFLVPMEAAPCPPGHGRRQRFGEGSRSLAVPFEEGALGQSSSSSYFGDGMSWP